MAEHNKLCNDSLLKKIVHILKKMRGINLDDFGNTLYDINGLSNAMAYTNTTAIGAINPSYGTINTSGSSGNISTNTGGLNSFFTPTNKTAAKKSKKCSKKI